MRTEIILPKLGFTTDEGILAEWLATEGQTVAAGAPLFSLETEKSTTEIEAPASGKLVILKAPGATYQVGEVLGYIEGE